MPNNTTNYGRLPIAWPDLGSEGGTTLHTQIINGVKKLADNIVGRWTDSITLGAGATSPNIVHSFGVASTQLNFVIFESAARVDRDTMLTNYTFNQVDTDTITITNNTGGSKTFYAYIFPTVVPAEIVETFLEWNDRSTDPTTPASGHVRLYPKNGKFYFIKSDGSVSPIGAGSGGLINYVKNQAADSTTDITSANATVAVTTTAGEVLIGDKSLKITNSGSSGGYLRFNLDTIDPYYVGKPLTFSLLTRPVSGSSYTANDMYAIIYNITDSVELPETKVFLPLGDYQAKGMFIPVSGKSYGLRIVCANASTGVAMSVDAPYVGPQTQNYTNVVTDWHDGDSASIVLKYGATTATNITSKQCRYKISGDSGCFEYKIVFNGAANANGIISINLPDGLVVDNSKIFTGSTDLRASATLGTNGKRYTGQIYADASGISFVGGSDAGSTIGLWAGNTTAGSNVPSGAALANNDYLIFTVMEVPLVNKSTNIQVADRALEEYAASTTGTWDAAAVAANTVYGLEGESITGALTANRNKVVRFQTPIQPTDAIILEFRRFAEKNWIQMAEYAPYYTVSTTEYGAQVIPVSGSNTDVTVSFYAKRNAIPSDWTNGTAWRVRKVSGGAAVGYPISPANLVKSIVRYSTNAAQSIANNAAFAIVDFEDKTFDTKNEVTTGAAWKFTAKEAGYYRVYARVMLNTTSTFAETETFQAVLYKNGSLYSALVRSNGLSGQEYNNGAGGDIIQLAANEYIDLRVFQDSGGALSLVNSTTDNYITIEQIG